MPDPENTEAAEPVDPTEAAIEARIAELDERENLSKARAEAVELALRDLVERGEWPPKAPKENKRRRPELEDQASVIAGRVLDVLKSKNVDVPRAGKVHKALAALFREF